MANGVLIIQIIILIVLLIAGIIVVYLILSQAKNAPIVIFKNGEVITLYDPYSQSYLGLCLNKTDNTYYLANGFDISDDSVQFTVVTPTQNPPSFANSYYFKSNNLGLYLDFSDTVNGVQITTKDITELQPVQVNFNNVPDPNGTAYTKNGIYYPLYIYYGVNISYGSNNMGPDPNNKSSCGGNVMVAKFANEFTYSYFSDGHIQPTN